MRLLGTLSLLCLSACAGGGSDQTAPGGESENLIECTEPRPEMCTQQYDPVCALRDTGIRCVTTPCDSTERRRYSNACTACADPDVYGYQPGDCKPGTDEAGG